MAKDESKPKGSRRHRKGDYQAPVQVPPVVPDPIGRQISAEDFSALIARAEAFAQRRFGPILPQLGAAFFKGRTADEVRDEGLQAAFRAWVLYGFRDQQGIRIIDMFASAGIPTEGEVARALTAARQARWGIYEVLERNAGTKQVRVRNWTTDAPSPEDELDVLDRRAFEVLSLGTILVGWFAPVGDLWRPLSAATFVPASRGPLIRAGLDALVKEQPASLDEFSQRAAIALFWLAYRVANLEEPESPST
jgi:hypothetical protein